MYLSLSAPCYTRTILRTPLQSVSVQKMLIIVSHELNSETTPYSLGVKILEKIGKVMNEMPRNITLLTTNQKEAFVAGEKFLYFCKSLLFVIFFKQA